MIRNKRGEGYISTCFMVLIYCIALALIISFVIAVNQVRIIKRNTYKIIDSFVMENSINAYNSIKVGTDTLESMNSEDFVNYFRIYNNLIQNGDDLIAYTDEGEERYRIKQLNLSFIEENTLKMQVEYIITVPLSFGDFNIARAEVPITIRSKLSNKF